MEMNAGSGLVHFESSKVLPLDSARPFILSTPIRPVSSSHQPLAIPASGGLLSSIPPAMIARIPTRNHVCRGSI